MLVGLLGKNAILIIEFAVQRREEGLSLTEAGRRRATSLSSDFDDIVCLHCGDGPACSRNRRRGDWK